MKKFILTLCACLCATFCLGLTFTGCSDDSSSDSGAGSNIENYVLESGQIPESVVASATEWRQNIGQYGSYSDKKELRDYLYKNTTEYKKTSVTETQLRQLLSELTPSASAIDQQMAELKRTTNDVQIIGTVWFYAEKPGANSSASDTTKTDTKTPSETTQTSDTTNTAQPQTPSETLEDLFKKKAVKQTLLSVPKELDFKEWAIDCDIPSSKLNGIKEGSILELSVNKQVLADYSQIRICPTGSWVSLDMKEFYAFANSAQLEDAMVATDGKNITLKSDSAIIYVKLSASDCTKLKNNGLTIHGHCAKIYSVKVGI